MEYETSHFGKSKSFPGHRRQCLLICQEMFYTQQKLYKRFYKLEYLNHQGNCFFLFPSEKKERRTKTGKINERTDQVPARCSNLRQSKQENNQREQMAIRSFSSVTFLAENLTRKCRREHLYLQVQLDLVKMILAVLFQ